MHDRYKKQNFHELSNQMAMVKFKGLKQRTVHRSKCQHRFNHPWPLIINISKRKIGKNFTGDTKISKTNNLSINSTKKRRDQRLTSQEKKQPKSIKHHILCHYKIFTHFKIIKKQNKNEINCSNKSRPI